MLGLMGKKVGMTEIFDDRGRVVPVTVVEIPLNVVIGKRDSEKHGYSAAVLAAGLGKDSRVSRPVKGQYPEGVSLRRKIAEMRDFEVDCAVGDGLGIALFENVGFVDISGTSKGKGTQGVMRRWNFGGGRKTHGSKFHRENGSTGQSSTPSRTIKGVKMAGQMGSAKVTVQNLRVEKVDLEKGVLLVRGAVPGNSDGFVVVARAKKKG